jgi:hypothetical protein
MEISSLSRVFQEYQRVTRGIAMIWEILMSQKKEKEKKGTCHIVAMPFTLKCI